MTIHNDIVIIGGGISGLLTARELRLAGREVRVIDKSAAGRESSWAGGGILLPLYPWRQAAAISTLVLHSLGQYPVLNRELLEATDIDPEWRQCGMLISKNPDFELAEQWRQRYGIHSEPAAPTLTDRLQTELLHPLWLPEIAQIRNPRLLKALYAYLSQRGVTFTEHAEISRVKTSGQNILWLETAGQRHTFNQLIVCAGAWSAEFLQNWLPSQPPRSALPIQPVKGQMLVFDARPDTLQHMVLDGDTYLIPRNDGRILAGSTVEAAGFDKSVTSQARDSLYRFATSLLPDLKDFPVSHHWAGLRPGSPQGVPYIGRHPYYQNLGVNAGHFRNGLVMAPASAQLLADLMLERPPAVDSGLYALNRRN
ncbi:MAG: glycine oxidase ThiO [Methylococcales bacterium]|nr:glycine oxidase ThiO [Methylococcales bacterium]